MTARTKSIAIVLGALLIGVAIGALATGAIINSRLDQFRALRMKGGMMKKVEQVVEPHDEAQRVKIREVLDRYAEKQSALRKVVVEHNGSLLDSMRTELSTILTPEQLKRLDDWMVSDHGPKHGPPSGDNPSGRHRRGDCPPDCDRPMQPDTMRSDTMNLR